MTSASAGGSRLPGAAIILPVHAPAALTIDDTSSMWRNADATIRLDFTHRLA